MSDTEWEPGRWWRVIAVDGSLWCETSDEQHARDHVRPGDRLLRMERRVQETIRWVAAPRIQCAVCAGPYDEDRDALGVCAPCAREAQTT